MHSSLLLGYGDCWGRNTFPCKFANEEMADLRRNANLNCLLGKFSLALAVTAKDAPQFLPHIIDGVKNATSNTITPLQLMLSEFIRKRSKIWSFQLKKRLRRQIKYVSRYKGITHPFYMIYILHDIISQKHKGQPNWLVEFIPPSDIFYSLCLQKISVIYSYKWRDNQ